MIIKKTGNIEINNSESSFKVSSYGIINLNIKYQIYPPKRVFSGFLTEDLISGDV
jgi:hypothetical protein